VQHYVVVYRVTSSDVLVMDPADGRLRRRRVADFAREWTGVALLLAPGRTAVAPPRLASPALRLWELVRPHRTLLMQALVGALVYTVLGLATSVYVRHVVDHVLPDGDRGLLDLMSVAMVALLVAQAYVGAAKGVLALRTGQRIDAELIAGYYTHLLRLPQRFFDTMRVGEVTSRVGDAVKVRAFVNDAALDLAVSALVVLLSAALMAVYSPPLALVTAGAVPLYWAVYHVTNRLNRRHQRALMERGSELESHLVESVAAAATVKRAAIERFAELRMETRLVRMLRSVYASALTTIVAGAASELLSRLVAVALLWVGAGLAIDGELTPGALMSCYALLAYLTTPLGRLVAANRTAQDALIAAERLFEIMDLEREDEGTRLDLEPDMVGDVRFERVSARYGGRVRVLHDVSFTAPRGALTAIVGESGCGKSTLAALVQRLYPADGGRVSVGDHDVAHLSLPSLRRAVAIVPQRAELFTGTLMENVALGELEPDVRRVVDVCRRLGLAELVDSLPLGLHTQLGEQGASLSGGQRQRVAIARAFYQRPAVLILDEATAALDSIAERQVQHAVDELTRAGCAVLVIAHRLTTVVDADNIVVLERGRVAEQGCHAELVGRGGVYSRLWAHQHAGPAVGAAA
jgi:ATP-binding cassette subfamily B protein